MASCPLIKDKVVTPIDFSDESFAALDQALELVGDASKVYVVHVLAELSPMEPGIIWGEVDNAKRSENVIQALRERLSDSKYKKLNYHILFGAPGRAIADYAKEIKADLILLPSHSGSGASRFLIGSVAERIVRFAPCSVLVTRKTEK